MVDPTGAIRYSELLSHTGYHLGHGYGPDRGHPEWSEQETWRIKDATKGGVLQVYKPPIIPGDNESHNWTFLRPVQQVVVASGAEFAPLPADFGGLEGTGAVRYSGSSSGRQSQEMIQRVGIGDIYAMRSQHTTSTGPPRLMAEEWIKGASDAAGQKCRLAVFPTANQEYTLWVEYYFNRDVESGMGEFIYGGADHWNLFVASVKAWCERHYDDGGNGSMRTAFMEELAGAVSRDRRRKAGTLGYAGDRRGRVWDRPNYPHNQWDGTTVTYQGQTW